MLKCALWPCPWYFLGVLFWSSGEKSDLVLTLLVNDDHFRVQFSAYVAHSGYIWFLFKSIPRCAY